MTNNKALELLKRARPYLSRSGGAIMTNTVYITPAQQLRNQANAIEEEERLIREIDAFLTLIGDEK